MHLVLAELVGCGFGGMGDERVFMIIIRVSCASRLLSFLGRTVLKL